MIQVKFDPHNLPPELTDVWNQLQANVDRAIKENITAWETWKQLKRYEHLLNTAGESKHEDNELAALRSTLEPFLTPEGSIKPELVSAKPEFNFKARQKIWSDIKQFLIEHVFHHKCAYCETLTDQFYFDAEHYRPKGELTVFYEDEGSAKHIMVEDEHGELIEHPGYFWLAFDWKNLVPSCKSCNGPGGKMTQFPVQRTHLFIKRLTLEEATALDPPPYPSVAWQGMYYLRTEQLDLYEGPLLLHPYLDEDNNPRRHIRFHDKGIEYAVSGSPKGVHSIKVFRLHKETLRTARQKAQERAFNLLLGAYKHYLTIERMSPEESWKNARRKLCDFEEGKEEFCAAALDYVEEALKPFSSFAL